MHDSSGVQAGARPPDMGSKKATTRISQPHQIA
jgi:hypothetical protein